MPLCAAQDIVFSFPVTCKDGKWTIVQGLTIDDYAAGKLKATGDELVRGEGSGTAVLDRSVLSAACLLACYFRLLISAFQVLVDAHQLCMGCHAKEQFLRYSCKSCG